MNQFLSIDEPQPPKNAPPAFALWALGFRPFYLLASVFAAFSIALWAAQFSGALSRPYLSGPLWHAHEMLFGFTLAVVVGFLFTAGRNWTGRPTPTGALLAALAVLWVAGRVLVLTPFGMAAAIVDSAFPLACAVALGIPFWAARLKRNYFFVGLLVLLSAANFSMHLSQLGISTLPGWLGVQIGLDAVLFIMAVMAGRVVPMFTNNGVPGANAQRQVWIEHASLAAVLLLLLADLAQLHGTLLALLAMVGAVAHGARWLLWKPWKTLRTPLVWVLHAAYAWIPLHLGLRAAFELGWIGSSIANHALTVGAIGGLTIGMMTRTARGHTGRPLRADRFDIASYVLIVLAAVTRVLTPALVPEWTMPAITFSSVLWSAGFAIYAVRYWPLLSRARPDGKPG